MNELLVSELSSEEKSVLHAFVLLEEFLFSKEPVSLSCIDEVIESCQNQLEVDASPLERAEHLINLLYIEHMFIDKARTLWTSASYQIEDAVGFRIISPILKAIIIRHIFEACDFDTDIVFVPEKTMVRVSCDDVYGIIFDPVTGESLDGIELYERLEDLEGDPSQFQLKSMSQNTLVVEHLSALKNALIAEQKFDQALKCVDVLLALRPNDPFERRDRGFLLHQLDCFKVAVDDYQYFVDQCPKDPAAQLLKLQLENITIAETVVH